MRNIRNFSIIAHVDHGKSTLADRFIQLCGGLAGPRDAGPGARLHGRSSASAASPSRRRASRSTTRAHDGERYQLNMIDTPGHVDFSYEVSRSLAACDGALLVVDASQGVEAQSVANCYTAIEQGLEVVPVINKIDLPSADPERVGRRSRRSSASRRPMPRASAPRPGEGVPELLETLIERIPAAARAIRMHRCRRSSSIPGSTTTSASCRWCG